MVQHHAYNCLIISKHSQVVILMCIPGQLTIKTISKLKWIGILLQLKLSILKFQHLHKILINATCTIVIVLKVNFRDLLPSVMLS